MQRTGKIRYIQYNFFIYETLYGIAIKATINSLPKLHFRDIYRNIKAKKMQRSNIKKTSITSDNILRGIYLNLTVFVCVNQLL